ncbi:general odorant-binding protein 56a-like [Condylostylus longicornis]|uniref:general odorant-binding protein 56a-like n=1 Tax=Condylostylus longicornis TaxID=2530218 RepID=UPI00244E4425|nr:general odorant-binding protein 56a-like [Condylostylus longicornis]
MKIITFYLTLLSIVLSVKLIDADQMVDTLIKNGLECLSETRLDRNDLEKLIRQDLKNPTENQKCFAKCVVDKAQFVKNGELDQNTIRGILLKDHSKEWTERLINACPYPNGKSDCSSAFDLAVCYNKERKRA